MKRLLSLLPVLLLLAVPPGTRALALEQDVYQVGEIQAGFSIPEKYTVSDRTALPKSQAERDALAEMRAKDICLKAVDKRAGTELAVVVKETPFWEISGFSDSALRAVGELLKNTGGGAETEVQPCEIYSSPAQARKYWEIHFRGAEGQDPLYGLCYFTIRQGQAFGAAMYSRERPLSTEQEAELRTMVEGMRFQSGGLTRISPENTGSFRFSCSTAAFTVPEGWEKLSPPDRRYEDWDLAVCSLTDPGLCMCYRGTPPESGQSAQTGHTGGTVREAAELMGVLPEQVSEKDLGGTAYFYAETERPCSDYGLEVRIPVILYSRWVNGCACLFQLAGADAHAHGQALESLLRTAEYPAMSPSVTAPVEKPSQGLETLEEENPEPAVRAEGWNGFRLTAMFLDFLIAVILYSLPVFVYRFAIRRGPVRRKRAALITAVYGAAALLCAAALLFFHTGGAACAAILLWSGANYRLLTFGGDRRQEEAPSKKSPAAGRMEDRLHGTPETGPQYCRYCGRKLSGAGAFCAGCGRRVR